MCGIVGYKGTGRVAELAFSGLKRLEYRGYDSWGFAVLSGDGRKKLRVLKRVGRIGAAGARELRQLGQTEIAVGHTRWATHGGIEERNAHPILDCTRGIAVVHNGIIENYQQLRASLKREGHTFSSDTDTETIAHLVEKYRKGGLRQALIRTARQLKGRYSFLVLTDQGEFAALRNGSPLIVGAAPDGYFIASDISAFEEHTRKAIYLDDGEMVVIGEAAEFYRLKTGRPVRKRPVTIDWESGGYEKNGYEHYLLKEIMDQKHTIADALQQSDDKLKAIAARIHSSFGTFLVGCGTAGRVCMAAEYLFSRIARKHVNYVVASEFPNYHHFLTPKTLLIAVSQSGETADVLEAIDAAKRKRVKVISVLNVFGSTMMRQSDGFLMVNAGSENAVVSTKATTAQLAVLMLLAYACAGKLAEGRAVLRRVARKAEAMLTSPFLEHIRTLAEKLYKKQDLFIIGRAGNYAMALEAAIKIQEASYIHAEGFAGGELKHGPIALIEKGTPCIVLVANDEVKDEILSNAIEVKSRGGFIIGISPEHNEIFDYWIKVPDDDSLASPILNIIPVQLLAYYLAVLRGNDPDKPRNLAKSVTVK